MPAVLVYLLVVSEHAYKPRGFECVCVWVGLVYIREHKYSHGESHQMSRSGADPKERMEGSA